MACLCAPTSHEGSFRCRLHRGLNPIPYPAQSIANHELKGFNYCTSSINAISNPICCNPTVRESSASASASTAPHPFYDHARFSHTPQVAADHQSSMRMRPSTSPSPWLSYRSLSSSPSSLCTASSSSSSRSSASSSSPSPSSPLCCTRPPPGKRTSSAPSKPPYRMSSSSSPSPSPSPSSRCGANGSTPSASHAAALAIMKQHSHNKHGPRTHSRNILSPTSASKIGPSPLSRMAVACSDELPLLKDEQHISNSAQHGSAPDIFSGSFAETAASGEFASFKAEPSIGLKSRSAMNKFKQSESSCRIVGSKEGSLIMPTVY